VPLAMGPSRPRNTITGRTRSEPPPAMTLMKPAMTPTDARSNSCQIVSSMGEKYRCRKFGCKGVKLIDGGGVWVYNAGV